MIIYGWNSKNIKQAPLESYECPNCQAKSSSLAIFSSYVHIFWIPIFPYKKSAQIHCTHCQYTQEEKDLSPQMKDQVKQLKSAVKTPVYLFSGLGLIALFVAYVSFDSMQNNKMEQGYIDDPQVGDVYIMKDLEDSTSYNHYLLKVTDSYEDSLVVSFNTFVYNGIVTALDAEDGFLDIGYAMHKAQIKEFDELGELKKVIRDYTSSSGFDRVIEYTEVIGSGQ